MLKNAYTSQQSAHISPIVHRYGNPFMSGIFLGGVYTTTRSGENEDFSIRFGRAFTPKR